MKKKVTSFIFAVCLLTMIPFAFADTVRAYIPGDVDGNCQILANDARLALRASARLETLTDEQKKAADVDGNGVVLADDARAILRISAKLDAAPSSAGITPAVIGILQSGRFFAVAEQAGEFIYIYVDNGHIYVPMDTRDLDLGDSQSFIRDVGVLYDGKIHFLMTDTMGLFTGTPGRKCYFTVPDRFAESLGNDTSELVKVFYFSDDGVYTETGTEDLNGETCTVYRAENGKELYIADGELRAIGYDKQEEVLCIAFLSTDITDGIFTTEGREYVDLSFLMKMFSF